MITKESFTDPRIVVTVRDKKGDEDYKTVEVSVTWWNSETDELKTYTKEVNFHTKYAKTESDLKVEKLKI